MRKKLLIGAAVLVAALACFGTGVAVGATSGKEPGSQSDPVVTLSYLEYRLGQTGTSGGVTSVNDSFTQKKLSKGQQLILDDGAELVIYSGNGTVVGSTGILSLTDSQMFSSGTSAVLYNLYLGLGSTSGVSASSDMTVYVKGGFRIQ